MNDLVKIIHKYLDLGLSVVPLGADKRPPHGFKWKPYQSKPMSKEMAEKAFSDPSLSVGIICGAVSGGLQVIDVDQKYSLDGQLWNDYKARIPAEIFDRLVIATTTNGGYHLIYRTDGEYGNTKFASRPATEEEKRSGEKILTLIESRGDGGYIAAFPTKNYKFTQKHLNEIPHLTVAEHEKLRNIAREFNQVFAPAEVVTYTNPRDGELSPLDDYDERGDVLALLVKHGWKIVLDNAKEALLRRPGKSDGHSAGFSKEKNWFTVFSSSTEFDQLKAYRPYSVYAKLECNGDFAEASRRLRAEGYGAERPPSPTTTLIKEKVENFLTSEDEDLQYLKSARSGAVPMGLETGIRKLDEHFRFKKGNFVVINGMDNVGKTLAILYLAVMSGIKHNWSWIIYAGENRSGYIKRKLIELYLSKPITAIIDDHEFDRAHAWVRDHFTVIANNDLYSYKDLLAIGNELMEKKKYDSFLIDPYNSLYMDMDNFSKMNSHDYHYQATSEFRLFCKKHGCCIYLNCHAVTEALRRTYPKGHDLENYPMPPNKSDTEGGGKFSNRADDFITIHRLVQHPDFWMWTEFHVRKIKETETGGRPTDLAEPVKIRIIHGNCGFEDVDGYNPITDKYGVPYEQIKMPVNLQPDRFLDKEEQEQIPF